MYGVKAFVVVFETHVHLMYFVFVFCNLKSIGICNSNTLMYLTPSLLIHVCISNQGKIIFSIFTSKGWNSPHHCERYLPNQD